MITIYFILPYPELQSVVEEIMDNHPFRDEIQYTTAIHERVEHMPPDIDKYDLVVARGYVEYFLRKTGILTIPIDISIGDILDALDRSVQAYKPKKIGVLWMEKIQPEMSVINRFYDCPVELYSIEKYTVEEMAQRALDDGCEALVGGYILTFLKTSMPFTVLRTSHDTLRKSLAVAIQTATAIRQERESAKLYQLVAERSQNAIVYATDQGDIKLINNSATSIAMSINGGLHHLTHGNIHKVFPFLSATFTQVVCQKQPQQAVLLKSTEQFFSVDFLPVYIGGHLNGILITLQDTSQLQSSELRIRSQLYEKGLVAKYHFSDIIATSPIMVNTLSKARLYAQSESNIFIFGESGTGKELLAQSIHNHSKCQDGPFLAVNCAAIPENLLESEMFGYVAGAFTGATKGGKIGLFEQAHHGTLFLDEISELPYNFQGKLLRALQEREIRRVGDNQVISVDIRVISASNRDLFQCVQEKTFREDLLYRLNVLRVDVPPLRERQQDVMHLFTHALVSHCRRMGRPHPELTPEAALFLSQQPFRGNVRELNNLAERVSVILQSDHITAGDLMALADFPVLEERKPSVKPSAQEEKAYISALLQQYNRNMQQIAQVMGIDRSTLWRKLKKYNLSK